MPAKSAATTPPINKLSHSGMSDQLRHYAAKLEWEIDPSDLQGALEAGGRIVVVDARTPRAYARGHIPGAVNIPHRAMSPETTAALDRGALVVAYCDGVGCNASTKGAFNLVKLGFRVKELIGGLEWWKKDGFRVRRGANP
jgi:rhodanese-related sulfurtransferase